MKELTARSLSFPLAERYYAALDLSVQRNFNSLEDLLTYLKGAEIDSDILKTRLNFLHEIKNIFHLFTCQLEARGKISKKLVLVLADASDPPEKVEALLKKARLENGRCRIELRKVKIDKINMGLDIPNIFQIRKIYLASLNPGIFFTIFIPEIEYENKNLEKTIAAQTCRHQQLWVIYYYSCLQYGIGEAHNFLLCYLWHNFLNCLEKGPVSRFFLNCSSKDNIVISQYRKFCFHHYFRKEFSDSLIDFDLSFPSKNISHQNAQHPQSLLKTGQPKAAALSALSALKNGNVNPDLLHTAAMGFYQSFDFRLAEKICAFASLFFPEWHSAGFIFLCARFNLLLGNKGEFLYYLGQYCLGAHHGKFDLSQNRLENRIKEDLGAFDWQTILVLMALRSRSLFNIDRCSLLALSGAYSESENLAREIKSQKALVKCFDMYLQNGNLKKAAELFDSTLADKRNYPNRLMEFYLDSCDKFNVTALLKLHESGKVKITKPELLFYAFRIANRYEEAYRMLARHPHFPVLYSTFPRMIHSLGENLPYVRAAMLVSEQFLADELLYSRLYPCIARKMNSETCYITCDHRVAGLLARTFPQLDFLPVKKIREPDLIRDFSSHDQLPDAYLCRFFDNETFLQTQKMDRVIPVLKSLSDVITEIPEDLPYLKPDPGRAAAIKERIRQEKTTRNKRFACGLSLRSSLTGGIRKTMALKPALLEKLLSINDILWINCQYDQLSESERTCLAKYENFINFQDIDQYNDVESTAALYASLDLMVSSLTFSAILAATCGTETFVPCPKTRFFCSYDSPVQPHFLCREMKLIDIRKSDQDELLVSQIHKKLTEIDRYKNHKESVI